MPTSEEVYAQLILRGIMPTDAERIVEDVRNRDYMLLLPGEAEMAAIFSEADIAGDLEWIFYTPDIPNEFRRMWTATEWEGD